MIFTSGTNLITAPASEPITTATAKEWLKVDSSADDTLIDATVAAARAHIEQMTGLALFTQTIRDVMDCWPSYDQISNPYNAFYLLRYPVQSVTSITYLDSDGASQTLSTDKYYVDTNGLLVRVGLKENQTWPTLRKQIAAVTINYTAGWSATGDIPDDLIVALKLLMTYYYERRADGVKQYATTAENIIKKHYSHVI